VLLAVLTAIANLPRKDNTAVNTYKRFGAVFVLAFVLSLLSTSIAAADSYIYLPHITIQVPATATAARATTAVPATGATTTNGWYEGEEIYYILSGVEEGITQRGQNDLYLIGGNRAYQANVAEFIPGEAGYSPHWNVNVVHTAPGVTRSDLLASPFVSEHYPVALFDDVEDILGAETAGLVTIDHPGVVVLCPIISEQGAEAPGHTQLSQDFPPFPDTF
jgi:hypothetical protein